MNQNSSIENPQNCCGVSATAARNGTVEDRWTYRPPTDILDQGREYTIFADVPGAAPESVNVTFEQGVLTIEAPVPSRASDDGELLAQEYGVGDYHRQFNLGDLAAGIDADAVTAQCRDGLLTIHLPKKAAAQPRKIAVKAT